LLPSQVWDFFSKHLNDPNGYVLEETTPYRHTGTTARDLGVITLKFFDCAVVILYGQNTNGGSAGDNPGTAAPMFPDVNSSVQLIQRHPGAEIDPVTGYMQSPGEMDQYTIAQFDSFSDLKAAPAFHDILLSRPMHIVTNQGHGSKTFTFDVNNTNTQHVSTRVPTAIFYKSGGKLGTDLNQALQFSGRGTYPALGKTIVGKVNPSDFEFDALMSDQLYEQIKKYAQITDVVHANFKATNTTNAVTAPDTLMYAAKKLNYGHNGARAAHGWKAAKFTDVPSFRDDFAGFSNHRLLEQLEQQLEQQRQQQRQQQQEQLANNNIPVIDTSKKTTPHSDDGSMAYTSTVCVYRVSDDDHQKLVAGMSGMSGMSGIDFRGAFKEANPGMFPKEMGAAQEWRYHTGGSYQSEACPAVKGARKWRNTWVYDAATKDIITIHRHTKVPAYDDVAAWATTEVPNTFIYHKFASKTSCAVVPRTHIQNPLQCKCCQVSKVFCMW
jgi:hypothetical protein